MGSRSHLGPPSLFLLPPSLPTLPSQEQLEEEQEDIEGQETEAIMVHPSLLGPRLATQGSLDIPKRPRITILHRSPYM